MFKGNLPRLSFCRTSSAHRWLMPLVKLALVLSAGVSASSFANLTVPSLSNTGSYTVSFNYQNAPVITAELVQTSPTGGTQRWTGLSKTHSRTFTGMAPGTYTYAVSLCGGMIQGCSVQTSASIVVVQNKSPTVSITAPASNAALSPGFNDRVAIKAQATDTDGTIARVEFYDDTKLLFVDAEAPYEFLKWHPTEGVHSLKAKAYDNLGNVTTSSEVQVTASSASSAAGTRSPPPFVASLFLATETELAETDAAGVTAGEFRVNESGAAQYSIPVMTAAGTAGVQPQISINYSSQGGNGLMGKGWSIGGPSEVSRCRQTLQQDGQAQPLTWGTEDRFCLDGQRLLVIDGDDYGSVGASYRTETDSFMKVTSVGGSDGHPDHFLVTAKDGSTTQYGAPGSSTSEKKLYDVNGLAQEDRILSWAISRFQDSAGNAIVYWWANSRNSFRLHSIFYAYGAETSEFAYGAHLSFSYEERPDWIRGYIDGVETVESMRLTAVSSYNEKRLMRTYRMTYENHAAFPLSRLLSVRECVSTTVSDRDCLKPTTFTWGSPIPHNGNYGGGWTPASFDYPSNANITTTANADINGDGRADHVWVEKSSTDVFYLAYAVTLPNGSVARGSFGDGSILLKMPNRVSKLHAVDYNADGAQDLVVSMDTRTDAVHQVFLATPHGGGEWRIDATSTATLPAKVAVQFGDLNADGLVDFFYLKDKMIQAHYLRKDASQSTNSSRFYKYDASATKYPLRGAEAMEAAPNFGYNNELKMGDFNGDGRADFLITAAITTVSGRSASTRFVSSIFSFAGDHFKRLQTVSESSVNDFEVVDFNGDGYSDLAYFDTSWYFYLNTGTGFTTRQLLHTETGTQQSRKSTFADVNLDGYPDYLYYDSAAKYLRYKPWSSESQHFGAAVSLVRQQSATEPRQLMDYNGDGILDVVHQSATAPRMRLLLSSASSANRPDLMHKVANGLGATTTISYQPLNRSENYSSIISANPIEGDGEIRYCEKRSIPAAPGWAEVCHTTGWDLDPADFYGAINDPFADIRDTENFFPTNDQAPVFEFAGPMYVVTKAKSSAPTASNPGNENAVAYHYHQGRYQAAGRGFLGFKKLATMDLQTGVMTETTYRQDWPFIGQPIETVTKSAEGNTLSQSTNRAMAFEFGYLPDFDPSVGTSGLGPIQVFIAESVEQIFELVGNGASEGSLIKETITRTVPDAYGNIENMAVLVRDGAGNMASSTTTTNTYLPDEWDLERGRLASTTVKHERRGEVTKIRTSSFGYYDRSSGCSSYPIGVPALTLQGLLCQEVVEPGKGDFQQTTNHFYDRFGNASHTATTAKGGTRLSLFTLYDSRGRYPVSTFGTFDASVGASAAGPSNVYLSAAGALKVSVQKVSEVTHRDKYGQPHSVSQFTGAKTTVRMWSYTTRFGNAYLTEDGTGSFSLNTAARGDLGCPAGTAFHTTVRTAGGGESRSCNDLLGRTLREGTRGFDGKWIYKDSEYDNLGQVVRSSEPFTGTAATYWTEFEYDLLGRVTKTIHPFMKVDRSTGNETSSRAVTTLEYLGLVTVHTNPDGQEKHEERNALGEIVSVTEPGMTTATYRYDVLGNMRQMTDPAGNATSIVYDLLGRKTSMKDPDKGEWKYYYNGFGELTCQQDANKQTTTSNYDANGRLISRVDRAAGGTCQSPTGAVKANATWLYDRGAYGLGKIWKEQDSTAVFAKAYTYDELGRPSEVATSIRGHNNVQESHHEKVFYDQYGRVYYSYDAARNGNSYAVRGVKNVYNAHGYLSRIVDSVTGSEFYRVVAMDHRGNVTQAVSGGVLTHKATYNPRSGMLQNQQTTDSMSRKLQDDSTRWDHLGNLVLRESRGFGAGSTALDIRESFGYDKNNQLTAYTTSKASTGATISAVAVAYNAIGNITRKTDVGSYTYNTTGVRPHAVTDAGGRSYSYDANGNMVRDGSGRTLTYTPYDMVESITHNSTTSRFYYGTDRARFKRTDTTGLGTTTTLYLGSVEKVYYADGSREWKRNIGGVALVTHKVDASNNITGTATTTRYLLKDHLGSTSLIVRADGTAEQEMAFDPWGKRRNPRDWKTLSATEIGKSYLLSSKPITTRGFTGHEMVDESGIIHMNGRIYDPTLGRFLQADPFIQAPTSIGSLNRYSYMMNNPLNGIDPSGFFSLSREWKRAWNDVKPFVGAIVGIALVALAPWATASIYGAFFAGAISGGAGAAAMGGNILKGALSGGVAGAAFFGIGQYVGNNYAGNYAANLSKTGLAVKVAMHSVAGGVMSVLQGGKFGHGFAAAGVTAGFSSVNNSQHIGNAGFSTGRVVLAAVVGGTVSRATGGKFANGAMTGAFSQAFNNEATEMRRHAAQQRREDFIKRWNKVSNAAGEVADSLVTSAAENIKFGTSAKAVVGSGVGASTVFTIDGVSSGDTNINLEYAKGGMIQAGVYVRGDVYSSGRIEGAYQSAEICFGGCIRGAWDYQGNFNFGTKIVFPVSIGVTVSGGYTTTGRDLINGATGR